MYKLFFVFFSIMIRAYLDTYGMYIKFQNNRPLVLTCQPYNHSRQPDYGMRTKLIILNYVTPLCTRFLGFVLIAGDGKELKAAKSPWCLPNRGVDIHYATTTGFTGFDRDLIIIKRTPPLLVSSYPSNYNQPSVVWFLIVRFLVLIFIAVVCPFTFVGTHQ